ncbi:reverse transcriptase domain-containing protein [Tanacetum coccineum]
MFYLRKEWANKLNDALWAIRTAYKSPIGSTPFRIVYGKACHLPIEMEHKAYWALKKERTKRWYDAKIIDKGFQEEEEVLVFNSRLKLFPCKLKTRWYGPYTVSKVFPYGTVEVCGKDGICFKVNGHRLKKYYGKDGSIKMEVCGKDGSIKTMRETLYFTKM